MRTFKFLILGLIILLTKAIYGQTATDFNSGLMNLTKQVCSNITDPNIIKIAVWDFTDLNGETTTLGKFISEEVTINLINVGKGFQIMNRNHLEQILNEHKLNTNGFIDQNTAKELGKLQAVDAVVTGTVTILNDKINVTMQILNTETANAIAAGKAVFNMNDDIKILLGINSYDNSGTIVNSNTGLKAGANEIYNDDKLVNKNCATIKSGDICFYNTTKYNIYIDLDGDGGKAGQGGGDGGMVKAGETKCFYSKYAGRYLFTFKYSPTIPANEEWSYTGGCTGCKVYQEGAIFVEECKSKTYTIK